MSFLRKLERFRLTVKILGLCRNRQLSAGSTTRKSPAVHPGRKFPIAPRIRSNQPGKAEGTDTRAEPWQTCNRQQQVRPYNTIINLAVRCALSFHPDRPTLRYFTNLPRVHGIHLSRLSLAARSFTRRRDLNCTVRA